LKTLLSSRNAGRIAAVPEGTRIYAIGDIHGHFDLFRRLADAIEQDQSRAADAYSTVILLGDLVDRGPESARVIDFAREWQRQRDVRIIGGNHEEMFLRSFHDEEVLRQFLIHGGRETILSYGMGPEDYRRASLAQVMDWMQAHISQADIDFLLSFEDMIAIGDYLFVHAGIAPEVPLERQSTNDLRWIREPFLSYDGDHGFVVIHGHTITRDAEDRGNRIGIDTGAYRYGRLTALVLEGTRRRYLETRADPDL
jgi:serine/threonine protein phosphatase 1